MKDEIICRCEEVSKSEIIAMIEGGATTMNEIKRWTRAGMGLCQGRTCKRLVAQILAETSGQRIEAIEPSSCRQPVVPVTLDNLGKE